MATTDHFLLNNSTLDLATEVNFYNIVGAGLLQVGLPSCCSTINAKALKDLVIKTKLLIEVTIKHCQR